MAKTFGQYREEWMGKESSDRINYCIPVTIGLIAQDRKDYSESETHAAVILIMKRLQRWFGKFSTSTKAQSHNELIVMSPCDNTITKKIAALLQANYGAKIVYTREEEIVKYCWGTIAVWDGIADPRSLVYQTVRGILSSKDKPFDDSSKEDYKIRFPENRPVFQIVLPDATGSLPELNYQVREIYPYLLETIPDGDDPWFSRVRYNEQGRRNYKRRNFIANAKKIKRFNKKIIVLGRNMDSQTKNIYDLLPWHHQDGKNLPKQVNIANLRQIFYDLISVKARDREKAQHKILMLLASVAMIFFSAFADLVTESFRLFPRYWLLIGYLVFISASYLYYWLVVKGANTHNRYLEFRALAEGMRVQCYWYAAGIDESVGDSYTVKFQKDMRWATQAFKAWYVTDYLMKEYPDGAARLEAPAAGGYKPDYDRVKTEWLGTLPEKGENGEYEPRLPENCPKGLPEQLGFYTRRIAEYSAQSRSSRRRTIGFTTLMIFLSAMLTVFMIQGGFRYENWFLFLIGLFNVFSLIATTTNHIHAYDEIASKYTYCKMLAQKALQDYAADPAKARQILKQFGVEALEENAEWLMIKNDREPAVPQ